MKAINCFLVSNSVKIREDIYKNYFKKLKGSCLCSAAWGILLIIIIIITIIQNPQEILTKHLMKIDNDSHVLRMMQQKLHTYSISMYIFNVTNPKAFLSGDDNLLRIEEVGPFTYKELRTNMNMEIDNNNNILKYTPYSEVSFVPEHSIANPKDVYLNVCNPILLSAASKVSKGSFLLQIAFNLLVSYLKTSPILNMSVQELLWGYDYPLVKFGRKLMPGLKVFDDVGMAVHMFGSQNRVRYEVDISDENRFEIKSVNDVKGVPELGYNLHSTDCNTFKDTYEGLFFPASRNTSRRLRVYVKLLCRFLELSYERDLDLGEGFDGQLYKIKADAFNHNEMNKCYCSSGNCYDGVSDASPCFMGLPVTISQGHFLNGDEELFKNIVGLHPNEEEHGSEIIIHKTMGIPIKTRLSFQIAIAMGDVSFNRKIKSFSNMVVPIGWGKLEQKPLPDDIATVIKFITCYFPKILLSVQIIFTFIGVLLVCYSFRGYYCNDCEDAMTKQHCIANSESVPNSMKRL